MPESPELSADEGSRELINLGTDLAGALIGGAVGLPLGPPGAMVGGAVGVMVQHGVRNLVGRLNRRGEERVGATVLLLENDVRGREEQGEIPRRDGFFDNRGRLRPEAEDLFEEILRQAEASTDERRIPLLARLYSAIAFDDSVSAANGKLLARVARDLTYRQFVALSVYDHHPEYEREFAEMETSHGIGNAAADPGIVLELKELIGLRLLGATVDGGEDVFEIADPLAGLLPRSGTTFGELRLLPTGEQLVNATRAGDIRPQEREEWIIELAGRGPGL